MTEELITIDGSVAANDSKAPIVHGTHYRKPHPVTITRFEELVVITDDNKRISVTADTRTEIGPRRKAMWTTLRDGSDHHKGRVKGVWLMPGDRVRVIGHASEHAFVPDTGTHREAPERTLSGIKAIAIGIGKRADYEVERALARYRRNTAPMDVGQARARRNAMIYLGLAVVCVVFAVMGRVHVSLATGFGALALTAWWGAQPLVHVPSDRATMLRYGQDPPEPVFVPWRAASAWAGFLVGVGVFMSSLPYWNPIPPLALVAEIFVLLPALAMCFLPYAMFGPVPDADPSIEVRRDQSSLLPADPGARSLLRIGFIALFLVSCVPMIRGFVAEKARQNAMHDQ